MSPEHELLRDHRPALEAFRMAQDEWSFALRLYGNANTAALARLVMIGWFERKPFDLSDLADSSGISRQQATRRIEEMVRDGWVVTVRSRNRLLVEPTAKLIDIAAKAYSQRMPRRIAQYHKMIALIEKHPILTEEGNSRFTTAKRSP